MDCIEDSPEVLEYYIEFCSFESFEPLHRSSSEAFSAIHREAPKFEPSACLARETHVMPLCRTASVDHDSR